MILKNQDILITGTGNGTRLALLYDLLLRGAFIASENINVDGGWLSS